MKKLLSSLLTIVLLLSGCESSYNPPEAPMDAKRIAEGLLEKINNNDLLKVVYNEDNDPNGLLGTEFNYTSKASIFNPGEQKGKYYITIEVFNNSMDAELRKWTVEETVLYYNSVFDINEFGEKFVENYHIEDRLIISNAFIRFDASITEEQGRLFKGYLNEILGDYEFSQINVSDKRAYENKRLENKENLIWLIDVEYEVFIKGLNEEISTFSKRVTALQRANQKDEEEVALLKKGLQTYNTPYFSTKISELEKRINEVEQTIINQKETTVAHINIRLKEIEKTKNQEELDKLATEIAKLEDSYYVEYQELWAKKIKTLEETIFKSKCKKYKYDDLVEDPQQYNGKAVYFRGKIVEIETSQGNTIGMRVNTTEKKYKNLKYSKWSDDIYITIRGSELQERFNSFSKDEIITIYGVMYGTKSYETVIDKGGNSDIKVTVSSVKQIPEIFVYYIK